MNTLFECLPYVAALSSVLVVAALNVYLRLSGEEGTLLFPSGRAYPEVEVNAARFSPPSPIVEQPAPVEEFRKAA